jgi:hypothetical protein
VVEGRNRFMKNAWNCDGLTDFFLLKSYKMFKCSIISNILKGLFLTKELRLLHVLSIIFEADVL